MTTNAATDQNAPSAATAAAHRGDIHGLRGLAIALVVLYHLVGDGRVSGGVDVFLMVSAYLLTGSLVRRGGHFRFAAYAIRRFRRLIPQAALVILATLLAGLMWLPPARIPTLLHQAQASLFYVQNWTLIDAATNYAAGAGAASSPLQHFWSLSMQGQVFVAWPLILVAAVRLRRLVDIDLRLLLGVLMGAILVTSFAYAAVAIRENPAAAYFNTFARLWEFALASLLALVPPLRLPRVAAIGLGWVGIAAIVVGGLVVGRLDFPGPAALWPSLAACAVLLAGSSDDPLQAGRWLSTPAVGWLADRAYGLYLWHWPVLIFWLDLAESAGPLDLLGIVALSLVLADVSTRLVERRFNTTVLQTTRGGLALIAAATVIVVGTVEGWTQILDREVTRVQAVERPGARVVTPGRPVPSPTAIPSRSLSPGDTAVADDWPAGPPRCAPDSPHALPGSDCHELPAPAEGPTKTVVMIGDSHSFQWATVMTEMARADRWHLVTITRPRCRVALPNPHSDQGCVDYSRAVVDHVVALRPDVVFTVATRGQPDGPELPVETWAEAARPMLEAGIPIVNMRDNPRWPFAMPECVQRFGVEAPRCTAPWGDKIADRSPLDELAQIPGMLTMDLTPYICSGGVCRGAVGGVYVYMDDNHLSRTYVRTLHEEFAAQWYSLIAP